VLPSRLSLARFVFSSFFSRDAYFARDGFILKSFHARTKRKENLHEERKSTHGGPQIKCSAKNKTWMHFSIASWQKTRRERAFSRVYPTGESASTKTSVITRTTKNKIEKKSAHYSHFLLFTLEFFASHTKPNFNYSRVPSVYKERSYIYIYIYIKRERERKATPLAAL